MDRARGIQSRCQLLASTSRDRTTVNIVAFENLPVISAAPSLVTIGTFDGVHLGHRRLLSQAIARARSQGLMAVIVTFEPIPAQVLRPEQFLGRICSASEKE